MRHLADPVNSQPLTACRWQLDHFRQFATENTHLSQHSSNAIFARSVLVQKQKTAATALFCRDCLNRGKWTHKNGDDKREHCLSRVPWSSSPNEIGTILKATAELPDLEESPPSRWPGPSDADFQLSPTQPVAALRNCARCPSEIPPPYGSQSLETSSFSHPSHTPSSYQRAVPYHKHSQ